MDFAISSPMYKDQASVVTVSPIPINLENLSFHSPWSFLTIPPVAMRFFFYEPSTLSLLQPGCGFVQADFEL